MSTQNKIHLQFSHPNDSRMFRAEVATTATGAQLLDGLIKAKFLEPGADGKIPYVLNHQRSGKAIAPSATVASMNIENDDVITVTATGISA